MSARFALAAGIGKALADGFGADVIAGSTTEIADEIVAYLTRPKTQPLLTRFVLEQITGGES